ncbi:MAG: hypothetical protein IJT58_05450 [Synergistaceae bacterium]|nr:hypothetical protein [Synergistaceae bacterium]
MNNDRPALKDFEIEHSVYYPVFEFKPEYYPGAVNPDLDGCPVMVLGVRCGKCYCYSFHDMTGYIERICQEAQALMIAHMKTVQAE